MEDYGMQAASGLVIFYWIISIAFYVYIAITLQTIAKKTNTENAWFAWIPILNIYLMTKIAEKPGWWLLLFFIPFVNFIIAIILWIEILKKRGYPGWFVILLFIPIVNFVVLGIVAWVDKETPRPIENDTATAE